MKAFVCTRYGPPDVLQLADIPKPAPADNEVLIEVYAASVNPLDWHLMRGKPFLVRLMVGLFTPKHQVLGSDVAGRVESVGKHIKQFQPGDEVFAGKGVGGFAEYACATEERLALKPANLSFEEAAAVPVAAITALQGLRNKGRIQPGQKVLIDGASGGVGTFAIQIAKSFGAQVTAVCSSRNVDIARSLGADHVIDYTREDFTQSSLRYDLIFAPNAYHSIFDYKRALVQNGVFVMAGGGPAQMLHAMLLGPFLSWIGRKKMCFVGAKIHKTDLALLKELLEARKIVPVIDRRYPFSGLPDALRYLGEGHAQGKVVITMKHSNGT
jgi:NADPH:quinone reductase-like Zn-dependent oxidoreductase